MEILENKSDKDLLTSMLAEIAKCRNEIQCAQGDIAKAQGRLGFLLVLANTLINRNADQQDDYR